MKNLIKKKLYLIVLTDFEYKILAIFSIRVIVKFDSMIHQIKLENRFEDKKKARF